MKKTIGLTIIACLVVARFFYLDADTPPLDLTYLYPLDEGFYSTAGFNLFHHGTFVHKLDANEISFDVIGSTLLNVMVYMSLLVFGNTYWGMRFASVLASLIMIWIFYRIARKENPYIHTKSGWFLFLIGLVIYLLTDFALLAGSRIAEPTIFRILAMMLSLAVVLMSMKNQPEANPGMILLSGIVTGCSVFFVYIYNLFLIPAFFVSIGFISLMDQRKRVLSNLLWFASGVIISFLFFLTFLKVAGNTGLNEYITMLGGASDRIISANPEKNMVVYFIMNAGKSLLMDFTTNIFRFNSSLLFLFILTIPFSFYLAIKEKDKLLITLLSLLVFIYLQSVAENSFSSRRMTLLLPIALMLIFKVCLYYKNIIKMLDEKQKMKIWAIAWTILSLAIAFFAYFASQKFYQHFFRSETKYQLANSYLIIDHAVLIVVFIAIYILLFRKKTPNYKMILTTGIFLFIPNIILDFQFIYKDPSYQYKNTMISLDTKLNNQVLPGGLAYSFRLYNSSTPVLNWFNYQYGDSAYKVLYKNQMRDLYYSNRANYYLGYNNKFTNANGKNENVLSHPYFFPEFFPSKNNLEIKTDTLLTISHNVDIALYKIITPY